MAANGEKRSLETTATGWRLQLLARNRACRVRSAASDFIPRQQSQLKGSEHEDEVAIVIRRGHVRASHSTAGIQTEMKEV